VYAAFGNTEANAAAGVDMRLTNVCYAVIIGDGKTAFDSAEDGVPLNASAFFISRRFDVNCATPVVSCDSEIVYGARPVFKWTMPGESEWASQYGSSYTAFRLQIAASSGEIVYDTGVRRAPAMNARREFVWTADISAGLLPAGEYKYRVQMLNSKFSTEASAKWSEYARFVTMVNAQQEINDHGYSSVKVSVKYAGSAKVLEKYSAQSATKGAVIVQAFTTADFSGIPAGESVIMNAVEEIDNGADNGLVKGIPALGMYYFRAYIDSNGNRKLDDWESWGYAKESVVLDSSVVKSPVVGIWIEDADTDGDWIPDALEYANAGWNGEWNVVKALYGSNKASLGELILPVEISAKIASGEFDAAFSRGYAGVSLTVFQGSDFAAALVGLDVNNRTSIEAIREAVAKKVKTVRVTSLAINAEGSKIVLGVDGDVADSIAGEAFKQFYEIGATEDFAKVKLLVYKKENLAQADWTLVETLDNVQIGAGAVFVEVPLQSQLDMKSGFYKVEVVQ
jgi:hypothetical protein